MFICVFVFEGLNLITCFDFFLRVFGCVFISVPMSSFVFVYFSVFCMCDFVFLGFCLSIFESV